jgi:hypothetical protein
MYANSRRTPKERGKIWPDVWQKHRAVLKEKQQAEVLAVLAEQMKAEEAKKATEPTSTPQPSK